MHGARKSVHRLDIRGADVEPRPHTAASATRRHPGPHSGGRGAQTRGRVRARAVHRGGPRCAEAAAQQRAAAQPHPHLLVVQRRRTRRQAARSLRPLPHAGLSRRQYSHEDRPDARSFQVQRVFARLSLSQLHCSRFESSRRRFQDLREVALRL